MTVALINAAKRKERAGGRAGELQEAVAVVR